MKRLYITNRDQWCEWLSENHAKEAGIWLVFYKKETSRLTIAYEAAVEEAIAREALREAKKGNTRYGLPPSLRALATKGSHRTKSL